MPKTTTNAEETKAYAASLLKKYPKAQWWLLYGDLGAGKTTFVKGFAEAMGMVDSKIKSPTFTLLEDHGKMLHVDLYRLTEPDHGIESELEEHAARGKIILVEWPERMSKIPSKAIALRFTHEGKDRRTIELIPPESVS